MVAGEDAGEVSCITLGYQLAQPLTPGITLPNSLSSYMRIRFQFCVITVSVISDSVILVSIISDSYLVISDSL